MVSEDIKGCNSRISTPPPPPPKEMCRGLDPAKKNPAEVVDMKKKVPLPPNHFSYGLSKNGRKLHNLDIN